MTLQLRPQRDGQSAVTPRARTRTYRADAPSPGGVARDVRLTPELAHRRLLVTVMRATTRVAVLLGFDSIVVVLALHVLGTRLSTSPASALGITLLVLAAFGAYRAGVVHRSLPRVVAAVVVAASMLLALSVLEHGRAPVAALAGYAGFLATGLVAVRGVLDRFVRYAYRRGLGLRRALLVGTRNDARTVRRLLLDGSRDQQVVGVVSLGAIADRDALGSLRVLPRLLRDHDVEEVVIVTRLGDAALDGVTEEAFAAGARCFAVPWALNPARARAEPIRLGACPAFRLHPLEFELPEFLLKRALDLVLTTALLVVAVPLGILISIAIRLETSGQILYASRRVGLGGREFVMYKFRSMRVRADIGVAALADANEYGSAPLFKMRQDPRVTRVGRFLRRTSLDELPQLINVLRGEMSLVGPRPPLPREVERYAPHHHARLCVLPGMTGPWQVGGRNLITDFEEIVRMERAYIETWSLGADLRILMQTVDAVASGRGAY